MEACFARRGHGEFTPAPADIHAVNRRRSDRQSFTVRAASTRPPTETRPGSCPEGQAGTRPAGQDQQRSGEADPQGRPTKPLHRREQKRLRAISAQARPGQPPPSPHPNPPQRAAPRPVPRHTRPACNSRQTELTSTDGICAPSTDSDHRKPGSDEHAREASRPRPKAGTRAPAETPGPTHRGELTRP